MSKEAMRQALEALESVLPQNMGPLIHPAKEALRAALAEQQPVAWTPASELPPPRRPLDFESVVVLAVAETDDGAYQITPAKVASLRKGEWREVRFDHSGQGRKIVVRCWMPMPKFPKTAPAAPEAHTTPAPQPLTALPPLPESEYWLAFYDEGGMQEASGKGYAADQMRDYARAALAEQKCSCGDRQANQRPGEWEPGCDLGANEKHAKAYEEKGPK